MSSALQAYLELERLMLLWDEAGEPLADRLRDAMDPLWYQLSTAERDLLNLRSIGVVRSLEAIRVPAERVVRPYQPPPADPFPTEPVGGWRSAA